MRPIGVLALQGDWAAHSTVLRELKPGHYEGPVPFHRTGLWEFRFAIRRGEDTFTQVLHRNVYAAKRD